MHERFTHPYPSQEGKEAVLKVLIPVIMSEVEG
jgi:hypothetical protein